MLINVFKLIVIGLFVYLIYNVYRFITTIKSNVNEARRRMEEEQRERMNRGPGRNDEKTIELNKDDYHVD